MQKAQADLIWKDVQAALREIEKKHNLTQSRLSGKYHETGLTLKVEMLEASSQAAVAAADAGVRQDPKQIAHLERHGWKYNLTISDIGKEFKIGTQVYLFSGMSSSAYAVAKKKSDGQYYRLRPQDVKLGLGK